MNFKKLYELIINFITNNFFLIAKSIFISSPFIFAIRESEQFLKAHMHMTLALITFLLVCFFFTIQYLFSTNRRIYKFSVWWNSKAIPHCCVCDTIVRAGKNPETRHISLDFFCTKCKMFITPLEGKNLFDALVAIQIMKEKLNVDLEPIPYRPFHEE